MKCLDILLVSDVFQLYVRYSDYILTKFSLEVSLTDTLSCAIAQHYCIATLAWTSLNQEYCKGDLESSFSFRYYSVECAPALSLPQSALTGRESDEADLEKTAMLSVSLLKGILWFFSIIGNYSSRVGNTAKDRIITFLLCYRLYAAFGLEIMYNLVPYLQLQGSLKKQVGFKVIRANCKTTPIPQTLHFSFVVEGIFKSCMSLLLILKVNSSCIIPFQNIQ